MKKMIKKLGILALILLLLTAFTACSSADDVSSSTAISGIDYDESYTTAEDVAAYLYCYGQLPQNFITKSEAKSLGWNGGGLEDFAPGCCIGGDKFGNYEGSLPEADGRRYFECDINTLGKSSRGAERLVFSNDGLIYYTPDHYDTFELFYGEE
jgi:guanyl-specific ribonuclease Sa